MREQPEILIVDDKKENLFSLEKILADTGAGVIRASCGNDALKASLNHVFALAILDVHMPEMDGYELAELLRGDKKTCHMPLMFLSAVYSDDYHVFRGYEAGAVDYITKPFNPKILLNKVNVFLELYRQKQELHEKIELQKSKNYLENVLMSISDTIIVVDRDACIKTVNRAAAALLEFPECEIVGEPVGALFDDHEFTAWIHALRHGDLDHSPAQSAVAWREKNIITKSGRRIPVLLSSSLLHSDQGALLGAVLAAVDITERKQADIEIRNLNKELESFSYSISHDLQAPLRSMDGFSRALLEDYGNTLDDRGKDYIGRVRNATLHMGRLIDDLLKLSRLSSAPLETESVDLSGLAADIITELQAAHPDRRATFHVAPDLCARGDARLLRVALQNLFSNAMKFTATRPEARIEFGCEEHGAARGAVFFVRDNGVGFDMQYADKLFGAFQRLHTVDEFPGTGIGLATVQRVIHRHGGRIWAQAVPDQGAAFFFSL